ncbi:lambda exonuclease family protein [Psittacicella hinzii]|uniref:lambda exonuclease family protein n=1 Tax=Psittacicella hinzii TaxID=2028575 RepID=UPI001CA688BD|nr:lambda exonuclease family protein [Psittacicella hinzii]
MTSSNLPYYEINAAQRSEEWFRARTLRLTASSAKHFTRLKSGKISKVACDMAEKVALSIIANRYAAHEIKDLVSNSSFIMQLGTIGEAYARDAYKALFPEYQVRESGLLVSKSNDFLAASPDGVVSVLNPETGKYEPEGLLEIKTPTRDTHINFLVNGVIPEEYYAQILHQLLVTGCKWVDFVTYYPDIDYKKSFAIKRVYANQEELKQYGEVLDELCDLIQSKLASFADNEKELNSKTYINSVKLPPKEVDRILKAVKKDFILYSNFGRFVSNRNGYETDEAVASVPTPEEIRIQEDAIIVEYLEDHPELKGKARRSLLWEAKRERRQKDEQELDEANQQFINSLE